MQPKIRQNDSNTHHHHYDTINNASYFVKFESSDMTPSNGGNFDPLTNHLINGRDAASASVNPTFQGNSIYQIRSNIIKELMHDDRNIIASPTGHKYD